MSHALCLPKELRRASCSFVTYEGALWLYDSSTGFLANVEALCEKVPVEQAAALMKAGAP